MSRSGVSPDPDIDIPPIKSSTYTTGRGGTGNMAKNNPNHPELARKLQDVGPDIYHVSEGESHFGRGGAANTIKMSAEEIAGARAENARLEREALERARNGAEKIKGWADKGKDFLKGMIF